MKRFNSWSLVTKLIVAFLVVAMIPLLLVELVSVQSTVTALEDEIRVRFSAESEASSTHIAEFLAQEATLIETLSIDQTILAAVRERNASYAGTSDILDTIKELDETWVNGDASTSLIVKTLSSNVAVNPSVPVLLAYKEKFDQHSEIFITDEYGATLAATDQLSDYYQADESWWQAAYNDGLGGIYLSDPEFDESANTVAVLIALPIYEGDEIIGIVRSTLRIDPIIESVGSIKFGETGRATLFDQMGAVIADPYGNSQASYATAFVDDLRGRTEDVAITYDETDTLTAFAPAIVSLHEEGHDDDPISVAIDNLNWMMVVRQADAEAFAVVTRANVTAILIFIAALFATLFIAYALARFFLRQLREIDRVFESVNLGDYETRAKVLTEDDLGRVASNLNLTLDNVTNLIQTSEERDAIQASIMKLLDEVSSVADGDLTTEAEVDESITGAIADSFNFMIEQLRDIITRVQEATLQVSASANQIQTTSEHLAFGSESQAEQILNTSAAIDEMSISIQQVSENAGISAEIGTQARQSAKRGAEAVGNTISGMSRIQVRVQDTTKRIRRLGYSSNEIGEIVQVIADIADRTSILALNASIQAAMAGEAGSGFAVVAEEVELLAEQSTDAARQIELLVRAIQTETNEAVSAMAATQTEVVKGADLANDAGQALSEIETVSERLTELIQSISTASKQQARGSESIALAMNEIADVTQQTAAGTKESSVSIANLARLADDLRQSISAFKIAKHNNG